MVSTWYLVEYPDDTIDNWFAYEVVNGNTKEMLDYFKFYIGQLCPKIYSRHNTMEDLIKAFSAMQEEIEDKENPTNNNELIKNKRRKLQKPIKDKTLVVKNRRMKLHPLFNI